MTADDNDRRVKIALSQPSTHLWIVVMLASCLGVLLFVTRTPSDLTRDWPKGLRDFVAFLAVVAAPVGSLSLCFWIFLLWADWRSQRSIVALLLLLAIGGAWSTLVALGMQQSPTTTMQWAKYGAMAGVLVGLLVTGRRDRYRRTVAYDRNTGKRLGMTPWKYVASVPFVPTIATFVSLAVLGAFIAAAAAGASLYLTTSP